MGLHIFMTRCIFYLFFFILFYRHSQLALGRHLLWTLFEVPLKVFILAGYFANDICPLTYTVQGAAPYLAIKIIALPGFYSQSHQFITL